jgi:DNA modification methylase
LIKQVKEYKYDGIKQIYLERNLLKELPDNSVDLVITSPPYSTMKKYIDDEGISADDYVDWFILL